MKHHTVILVPHAQARLRKWRVTNLQIALAVTAFLLVTGFSSFILWSFFTEGVDGVQVERLRKENLALREANREFEVSLEDLQARLGEYEVRTEKLAIVAGIEDLEGAIGGVGGAGGMGGTTLEDEEVDPALLEYRSGRLGARLDRVEKKLEERMRWISSTPSIAPVKGILTSGFGPRRDPLTGRRSFHPAIDLSAPPGRPVLAPADGLVTRAGRIGGLGNAVYLSHGYGLTTRYGHMSRLAVEPGQRVARGDTIGYVGSSGRSTGYHLHYEVRLDGEPINPLAYILE